MIGIVVASAIAFAVGLSVGYLVRDVRRLHRSGKALTERPGDADGVSPAGITFMGNVGSH